MNSKTKAFLEGLHDWVISEIRLRLSGEFLCGFPADASNFLDLEFSEIDLQEGQVVVRSRVGVRFEGVVGLKIDDMLEVQPEIGKTHLSKTTGGKLVFSMDDVFEVKFVEAKITETTWPPHLHSSGE